MSVLSLIVIAAIFYFVIRKRIEKAEQERKRMNHLIQLQNYITGVQYSSLQTSELQLRKKLSTYVNSHTKKGFDYHAAMFSASTPKAFFDARDKWLKEREFLNGLNAFGETIVSLSETPKEVKDEEDEAAKYMIERYWGATVEKVVALKTEKAKVRALETFFNTMFLYDSRLSPANQAKVKELQKATFVD